jgi:hypothetical protein
MKDVFGVNYFIFCFIVLAIVLLFTKDMRNEAFFDNSGALQQLASTHVPELNGEGFFGMSPGTLTQLQSTSVPSGSSCSQLPPMSTSMMNPMSTPLGDLIQHNLTEQGIARMTEVPKKDPGFYTLI